MSETLPTVAAPAHDLAFLAELRAAIERYFAAVDAWESAYRRYYRMPGFSQAISTDLAQEHSEYTARRRELDALLPRAQQLCRRHDLNDFFAGLRHVNLGQYAPQERTDSAVGRNERRAITNCLLALEEACREWTVQTPELVAPPPAERGSLLRRILGYFW
jgi:hypothetical protein